MKNAKEILNWYIMSGISDICADEPYTAVLQKDEQPHLSPNGLRHK